jgi:hypothetical protein
MLDDADMREPEFISFLCKTQRVVKVIDAGFLIGPDVGKKLYTELHGTLRVGRG